MNLPYDFSRCVGATDWATKEIGKPETLQPECVACRRREPGHPTRQVYIAVALDASKCINRIKPE
jgi:hypothetical protein